MGSSVDDFELRPLGVSDAADVAAVIRSAFADQGANTDPPSSALRETTETVEAKLAAGGGAGLQSEGAWIGVVLWAPEEDALHLGRLAVLPAWRGRGLADRLLEAAEAETRRRGSGTLRLQVRLELPRNRLMFARHGFVQTGARSHPGHPEPTIAVMEKAMS
jgi:GNAT superfamily N-acetyltransferase